MPEPPVIWVLAGERAGDRAQLVGLAEALGWPFEVKTLACNGLYRLPALLLGASLISLDRRRSSRLAPPWPDLILASGRRSVPAARWIRARSGRRARLVHVGRPWAPPSLFDLVITTPQYQLPDRPNILHNTASLHRLHPQRLAEAAKLWESRLAHLPRPYTALLVGGDSRPYFIDVETARRLGREASAFSHGLGGSLLVSASRRTPPQVAEALFAAITVPAYCHRWDSGGENPYLAYLALADAVIVTGDSASMLSEAHAAGKPVYLFDLPERPDWRLRVLRRFRNFVGDRPGGSRGRLRLLPFYEWLVNTGILTSTRDLRRVHEAFLARGWAARLGDPAPRVQSLSPDDEMDRAVQRVHALFERP